MQKAIIKSYTILLLVPSFFFITCCAATLNPLHQKLLTDPLPRFEGLISPISIPIRAQYKPVTMTSVGKSGILINIEQQASSQTIFLYSEMTFETKVSPLGDMLLWDERMEQIWSFNGRKVDSGTSILDIKRLTDKFGRVQVLEVSGPGLSTLSNEEHKKLADIIGLANSQPKKYGCVLREAAICSGDTIAVLSMETILNTIGDSSLKLVSPADIKYVIQGWGWSNSKKVIVATVDEIIAMRYAREFSVPMMVDGYALFDPDTFQILEQHLLFKQYATGPKGRLSVKGLLELSSRIIKADHDNETTSSPLDAVNTNASKRDFWTGTIQNASKTGLNGIICGPATFSFYIEANQVNGNVKDSYGNSYTVSGEVDHEGRVKIGIALSKRNMGTFTGTMNTDSASGIWQDQFQCYGTWTAQKARTQ